MAAAGRSLRVRRQLPVVPGATSQTQRDLGRSLAGIDDRPGPGQLDQILGRELAHSEAVFIQGSDEYADQRLARLVIAPPLRGRTFQKRLASFASGLPGHAEDGTKKPRNMHRSFRTSKCRSAESRPLDHGRPVRCQPRSGGSRKTAMGARGPDNLRAWRSAAIAAGKIRLAQSFARAAVLPSLPTALPAELRHRMPRRGSA